jgi:hypothetical protein
MWYEIRGLVSETRTEMETSSGIGPYFISFFLGPAIHLSLVFICADTN